MNLKGEKLWVLIDMLQFFFIYSYNHRWWKGWGCGAAPPDFEGTIATYVRRILIFTIEILFVSQLAPPDLTSFLRLCIQYKYAHENITMRINVYH